MGKQRRPGWFSLSWCFSRGFFAPEFPRSVQNFIQNHIKKRENQKKFPIFIPVFPFPWQKKDGKISEGGGKAPKRGFFLLKKSLEKPENCGFPTRTQKAPILAQNSSLIPFPGRIFLCFFPREFQFGIQTRESPLRSELR